MFFAEYAPDGETKLIKIDHFGGYPEPTKTSRGLPWMNWNLIHSVPDAVKVQVTDGCVALRGATEWQYQKEEEVKSMIRPPRGVKWVWGEITVTPKVSAVDLKIRIEIALKLNAEIDANALPSGRRGVVSRFEGLCAPGRKSRKKARLHGAAPGVTKVEDLISIRCLGTPHRLAGPYRQN